MVEEITVPDTEKGKHERNVLSDISFFGTLVNGVGTLEKVEEILMADGETEHHPADHGCGAVASADIIEHVK